MAGDIFSTYAVSAGNQANAYTKVATVDEPMKRKYDEGSAQNFDNKHGPAYIGNLMTNNN